MQEKFIVFENDSFKVLRKAFGEYQTNCYLALDKHTNEALIIDAGIGASDWVIETLKGAKPLAILNTHGHFDHIWSNAELTQHFVGIPLLCPLEDAFMLMQDCFELGLPISTPNILVGAQTKSDDALSPKTSDTHNLGRQNTYELGNFVVEFICYPGHTPGCSVIVVESKHQGADSSPAQNAESPKDISSLSKQRVMFSGDFIFYRSIGRSDFPYSSNAAMKASLEEFMQRQENLQILPGHGESTSVAQEKQNIPYWLTRL